MSPIPTPSPPSPPAPTKTLATTTIPVPRVPFAPPPASGWYRPAGSDVHHYFVQHVPMCHARYLVSNGVPRAHYIPAADRCPACIAAIVKAGAP